MKNQIKKRRLLHFLPIRNFMFKVIFPVIVVGLLYACTENEDIPMAPDADQSLINSTSNADQSLINKIDSIWTESMKSGTGPGMSTVVIKNGEILFQKGYGYADLDRKTPVTKHTLFTIGSTTKAMTAMAVLSLVDKGLVKLDEKVTTYIPDFVMKDARYKDITVRHLLSNSSGIRTFTVLPPINDSPEALEGFLEVLKTEELEFSPGEGFFYSNYGFTLAGLLVQRVSNVSYEEYMQDFLFDQLNMDNTTLEYWQPNSLCGTKGYVLDPVNGYVETAPFFNRTYSPAGAATITNAEDLARYLTTLVTGFTTPGGSQLLSDSLVTKMYTGSVKVADNDPFIEFLGATGHYGYGWYIVNRDGFITIEHGGNILSFLSYFIIDPQTQSAVGILVNQEDFTKVEFVEKVARLLFASN